VYAGYQPKSLKGCSSEVLELDLGS
jgi:hypothetical protein